MGKKMKWKWWHIPVWLLITLLSIYFGRHWWNATMITLHVALGAGILYGMQYLHAATQIYKDIRSIRDKRGEEGD